MSIFSDIFSIFIEKNDLNKKEIKPRSLLNEYKKDLENIFFDDIFVATDYNNIKNEIERYKFFSDRSFVKYFSDIFCQIFVQKMSNFDKRDFVVTEVPMHWTRYFIRGFNHMSYLAKYFAKTNNFKYLSILKTRFTKRQVKLNKKQRIKNRENKYFVKNISKIPENVILLDDVISTWTSINFCSKVLKNMWVKRVFVFILATNKK